ncbi:MAG: hypothetical protein J6R47_05490, partial [Acholeplasmatales bacterium]|nr:hypothetical protein [Acholeplasmatales bacterium]
MAKKKDLVIQNNERFVIPQINHSTVGLMRKKEGFRKSKVASPYHGTNVLDKTSYYDNSGSVDISYNYDFVREKNEKHLSDDELIRRHGTKYYEFTILNKDKNEQIYQGAHYKNKEQDTFLESKKRKGFGFIDDLNEYETPNASVIEQKRQEKYNQNFEFSLNFGADEDDSYEQTSYSQKPKYEEPRAQFNWHGIPSNTTEEFTEEIPIDERYKNSGLDLNQTIEQAMQSVSSFVWEDVDPKIQSSVEHAAQQFASFNASNESQSFTFENMPDEHEDKSQIVYKQNYDDYLIPYHKFLEKNESQTDEFPQWLEEKKEIINQALASFQIDGEVVNYTKGPAFTRYEIMLGAGVNVKKVNTIYENLQAALQATSIRLQTPIPGKNTVG